ncbi:MAG TPA: ABC transporter permease [Spirochaetota bacterium]|nr:ABC transporter permease [Spirochaetota bacterium]HQF07845.1 ABC transporter permease [Spirochaetota bacterium]HQH96898.1 ABC transporter permease [Spirochaetota bacterium]HQJ72747.1 ABC transporter permease [Spirochaetota bacterium]HRS79169.1 ABC transporter permease [Spirochaetota bacterium]
MSYQNLSIVAIRALQRNKMRTFLTCLGIIIGVFSVILLIGVSNSMRVAVREKIQSFGSSAIMLMSFKKPFNDSDLTDIRKNIPDVQYLTPMNNWEFLVKYKNKNLNRQVYGVNNDYFRMGNWELESGSLFAEEEIRAYDKVVIIGSSIKKTFFEYEEPVGKVILINRIPFRIVGCLKEKGMSLGGRDFDDFIVCPYTTLANKLIGIKNFVIINMATYSESQVDDVKQELLMLLQRKYNLQPEQLQEYKISSSKEVIQKTEEISGYISLATVAIAFISLVVGGIGIMNIMLASVSERTHEIGIRMAIGAKNRDILMQFLIEALILSSLGGITGIIIGVTLYVLYTVVSNQPFILSLISIIGSFLSAAMVGIVSGYYPAKKASKLNPIDALRYE